MTSDHYYQTGLIRAVCHQVCKCAEDDDPSHPGQVRQSLAVAASLYLMFQQQSINPSASGSAGADTEVIASATSEQSGNVKTRAIGVTPEGDVTMYERLKDDSIRETPIRQSLPARLGGYTLKAGACKDNDKAFCPQDDNTPDVSQPIEPPAPKPKDVITFPRCGIQCDDHNDCSGSWRSGCRCISPKLLPQYAPGGNANFPNRRRLSKGRCLVVNDYVLKQAAIHTELRRRELAEK